MNPRYLTIIAILFALAVAGGLLVKHANKIDWCEDRVRLTVGPITGGKAEVADLILGFGTNGRVYWKQRKEP